FAERIIILSHLSLVNKSANSFLYYSLAIVLALCKALIYSTRQALCLTSCNKGVNFAFNY
ncbi:hypothetical protein ACKS9G_004342, partial [Cronobacter turicensis]